MKWHYIYLKMVVVISVTVIILYSSEWKELHLSLEHNFQSYLSKIDKIFLSYSFLKINTF